SRSCGYIRDGSRKAPQSWPPIQSCSNGIDRRPRTSSCSPRFSVQLGSPLPDISASPRKLATKCPRCSWLRFRMSRTGRTRYVTGRSEFRRWAPVAWTEIINTPIQSDEVLIVGDAMVRLTRREDERLIPNLMIHDDLTFWWQPQDIDKLAPIVIAEMLDVPFEWAHVVPISVEMSVGDDWFDMEDVGKYESDTWDGKVKKPPP